MSTRVAPQRASSQLPLGLKPYHVVFVVYFSSIVLLGTLYSLAYGTHIQNLNRGLSFPLTSGLEQSIPSVDTGAASTLPPIPPTVLQPNHALTYWANRKNIVNRLFVKQAWLWTSIAWLLQLFFLRLIPSSTAASKKDDDKRKTVDRAESVAAEQATIGSPVSISVLRYLLATSTWLLFANWFFGPPLTERILTATGAVCVPSSDPSAPIEQLYCRTRSPLSPQDHPALFAGSKANSLSSRSIRAIWKGGHDISGHTFIMVLSSLFLLQEIAPYLPWALSSFVPASVLRQLFPPNSWARLASNPFAPSTPTATKARVALLSTVALLALWSWMLLNTAIYFHTPQEKISGLIVALLGWAILPKSN